MRLPRRVPWSSIGELDQICAWIYADENDLDAKLLAVNRLSAWRTITALPHALDSTLSILVTILQDKNNANLTVNQLSLRQSYAAAILRMVNGLVDPLQLGAYARSIASIAAQLGLPAWFVELRHAATHEDLPSLELLREAAQQSMNWLLHNYFLPTINPASAPKDEAPLLRPLMPVLKNYKTIMKIIIRDASLRSRFKQDVNIVTRDVERWITEAKVTANIIVGDIGWDSGGGVLPGEVSQPKDTGKDEELNPKEKWALEQFCDMLLEKGGLVPLSRKKRVFPEDRFWPPTLSLSLWTPLLKHIQVLHTGFAYTLCTSILSVLLALESSPRETRDPSYEICLARWVIWAIDTWSNADPISTDLQRQVTVTLIQKFGHRLSKPLSENNKATRTLLQVLCKQKPQYQVALDLLMKPSSRSPVKEWRLDDITTMANRLNQLLSIHQGSESAGSQSRSPESESQDLVHDETKVDIPGWRQLDFTNWKPCPIGVYYKPS